MQPFANNGIVEPCEVYEHPYIYLGWAINNAQAVSAAIPDLETNVDDLFTLLNTSTLDALNGTENDWEVIPGTGNAGGDANRRLREGIERFMVTDINNPASSAVAQSELAVMWDEISAGGFNPPQSRAWRLQRPLYGRARRVPEVQWYGRQFIPGQ